MPTISLIIPCFNEESVLEPLYKELCAISRSMGNQYGVDFEFLLVNDGSKDATLPMLRGLADKDSRVRYISFSRNFGKESAIYAGLRNCAGDYAAVMDADLQHPPSMLPAMYEGIVNEGYDCVAARRTSREGEPMIRSFFSRAFYKIVNSISKTKMISGATDFSMMTRQVIDSILAMPEYNRFSKGIYSWVGFETKWLPYENVERIAGSTKWSFGKLFLYSMDGIISFSTAPLAAATILGVLLCAGAFFGLVYAALKSAPAGEFSVLICVICLVGGIQLLCTGIAGQYIAKMYLEVKRRPIYLVKESRLSGGGHSVSQANHPCDSPEKIPPQPCP